MRHPARELEAKGLRVMMRSLARHYLTLLFVVVGAIVLSVGGFLVEELEHGMRETQQMQDSTLSGLDLLTDLQYQTQEARRVMVYALTTVDSSLQSDYITKSDDANRIVSNLLDRHRQRHAKHSPAGAKVDEQLARDWERYLQTRDKVAGLILAGNAKSALELDLQQAEPQFNQVRKDLDELKKWFQQQAADQRGDLQVLKSDSVRKLILMIGLTLLLAGLMTTMAQKAGLLHEVQASEARLREVMGSINEGMVVVNSEQRVEIWNEAAERTLGKPRAEVLGRIFWEVFSEARGSELEKAMAAAASSRRSDSLADIELLGPKTNRFFEVRVFPFERGITIFFNDTTERKKAKERLAELNKKLILASRHAGMAEIATDVLHNVGNVLNSVNVSTSLIRERIQQSQASKLGQVAGLLKDHAFDLATFMSRDPRGKVLPGYLSNLAERMAEEEKELARELELLSKNLGHVKDIVAMQQNYAKSCGINEQLPPASLVEDALLIIDPANDKRDIQLVREFEDVPPVVVDKHKVLQILVNLTRNARHAVEESGRPDKRITIGIHKNGGNHIKIKVADNGVGIATDNLKRIFAHGFTTRKDGHGFGLHSGAIAAKELGGSLRAHSEGVGQGATFTLELPIAKTEPIPA